MATEGYLFTNMHNILRILAFAGALLLITANVVQDAIGLLLLVFILLVQRHAANKVKQNVEMQA